MHGKSSPVTHGGSDLFVGLPDPFEAMRYHSLVVEPASLPSCLEVTARGPGGIIMGVRHRDYPIFGVQFHPESIGTPAGRRLMANFISARAPLAPRAGERAGTR
jgi:anthranilate synthase/aminodeoxychorismate synthase-like glutamine amidotransferase